MDYAKLGLRIRERRLELKLSQEKLAEMSGISSGFQGQIERAERKPSIEAVMSIASALNVSVDYLLIDSLSIKNSYCSDKVLSLFEGKSENAKSMALDVAKVLLGIME